MKKSKKILLTMGGILPLVISAPLVAAGCKEPNKPEVKPEDPKKPEGEKPGTTPEVKPESNSDLNDLTEAVKKANFQYKDIDKVSMFDKLNKENLSNNFDKKFKVEVLKLEVDKKINSVLITYNISFNDGSKDAKLENQKYSLTGLSTNNESYLNGLLNDKDTVFNLGDASNEDSLTTVEQLDAYYLVDGRGSISLLASNKNVYVPEGLMLEYTWNEQNETNKKFNGEVELDVSVKTKDNKTITRKNVKIANKIAEGVSDDYLTKYKKLTLNYKDADKTSINSFKEGDIEQTLKNNFIAKFEKSSEEETKKFLEDNGIKYEVKSITEISLEKKTINVNLQITLKNKKLANANIEVSGFKGVEKVSDEQVKKIVDKLTFGDVYFPEKIKEISKDETFLNELPLYIKDEHQKINPEKFVDSEYLIKNGITEFDKNESGQLNYKVKYDENAKKLSVTLKLNGKEYNVETTLTHELKLDDWVNEVGKEINGDSNTIPVNEFSNKNLKLNKKNNDFINGLDFIKLNSIKRAKSSEAEKKLNSEGKATLIYEFRNIYDNSIYTKEVIFENLKKAEKVDYKKQHASLIQKINDKKIITNNKWALQEEINKISAFKSNKETYSYKDNEGKEQSETLSGRFQIKGKSGNLELHFGDNGKARESFKELKFDNDFLEAIKSKTLVNVVKDSKHDQWVRFTQHNGKWCIVFAFKDDPELTPYYVQIEQ
ncbi:variable surface lipoprotein [Metamycoplasma hominis]|uniref:variable surface lipoprotein n=1 Tax=Metamycoplasma hominis TaxID=2098 RepID=UPI000366B7F0|nr:variable surface lipoprotein [Metamycoplasma hominis]AIU33784.1 lipoprotein [Metamycoplasma hominis ATCC 27545]QKX31131.1 variable surface lipoprotein [Metamycoplasma hominis]